MSDMKYFDGTNWITLKGEDGCDPQVTALVGKTVTLPAGQNALAKVTVGGTTCDPSLNFEFSIPRGADGIGTKGEDGEDGEDGKGWTGGSYSSSTGKVTFTSDDSLGFTTDDLRGKDGTGTKGDKGDGWTGGSYSDTTGKVTFTSADGLGFSTGDLRGADGIGTKGDDGDDGKGWTGGSYSSSTGKVTFTSDDSLGFTTDDLRGKDGTGTKGDKGDGWTGGSYSDTTGKVTFTSADGLGFVTDDLRGGKGDKGDSIKGDDGTSVDLTTVSVNTADCSVTPDSSSGAFVSDVDGADGTKQYKLDLTLPRPPVVTTSETEPVGACDGDFWADTRENEILPEDEYRTLWGTWDGAFGTGEATDENGKLKSEGLSSIAYISLGTYDINFEKEFPAADYCWVGQAGMTAMTTPTATVAGLRTGFVAVNKLTVYSNYINSTTNLLYNYETISVIIFDRIRAP